MKRPILVLFMMENIVEVEYFCSLTVYDYLIIIAPHALEC